MEWGAFCFGAVVGWVTYFTMRYAKGHAISDIATIIGAIGGAAILALFPADSSLFAYYGVGLAAGFFAYVLLLIIATLSSKGWGGLVDQKNTTNPFMLDQ